ncbi:MAG: DUF1963 domain-containing protein [Hyphomicrobium sp.]
MSDEKLEERVRSAIVVTERDSILLEPVYPPNHTLGSKSYFGGRPRLPADILWPVSEIIVDHERRKQANGEWRLEPVTRAVASTFIAQIDLSELPESISTSLPRSGTLYFFIDTATEDLIFDSVPGTGGRVVYWPGDSATVAERPEPDDLAPCFGKEWTFAFRWLAPIQSEARQPPRSFPKWGVCSRVVKTLDITLPFERILRGGGSDESSEQKAEREQHNQRVNILSKCYGELLQARRKLVLEQLPRGPNRNYFVHREGGLRVWRGGEGYPYAWIDIEVFCGTYLADLNDKLRRRPAGQRSELISSREEDEFSRIAAEARDWVERGTEVGRFTAVDDATRQEFGQWYDQIIARSSDSTSDPRHWTTLQGCIAEAYRIGPRLCLAHSPEAASLVPDAWCEHQRWQWAIRYKRYEGSNYELDDRFVQHQLLGPRDHEISATQQSRRTVPLMSLDSQDGLFWKWGDVGSIEFRIPETDLAGMDFSKCYVVLRSG